MTKEYNITLSVSNTVSELRATIKEVLPFIDEAEGVSITITGYDRDRRELWEIPEVCSFARILVAEGFLGVAKVPSGFRPAATTEAGALNGLAVFLMSREIGLRNTLITPGLMREYFAAMQAANALIAARYLRPTTRRSGPNEAEPKPRAKLYYWVAINQHSVAMSSVPLPDTVVVTPVPQVLIGFDDAAEAGRNMRYLLTAPHNELAKRMKLFRIKEKRGEVVIKTFAKSEPPQDETHWDVGR